MPNLLSLCTYNRGDIGNAFKNIRKGYEIYWNPTSTTVLRLFFNMYRTVWWSETNSWQVYFRNCWFNIPGNGVLFKCALNKTNPKNILNSELANKLKMDAEWIWLIADFYSLMGRTEEAIFWLEHAVSKGFINYYFTDMILFLKIFRGEKVWKLMNEVKTEWEKVKVRDNTWSFAYSQAYKIS